MMQRSYSTFEVKPEVKEFSTLPPEIVHSIFDDLPIKSVLQIAAHHHREDIKSTTNTYYIGLSVEATAQASYFDQCVLTHIAFRQLVPTLGHLVKLASMWSVFHTLRTSWDKKSMLYHVNHTVPDNIWSRFGLSPAITPTFHDVSYMWNGVGHSIWTILTRLSEELQTLSDYTEDVPLAPGIPKHWTIEASWENVMEAMQHFRALRCEQLNSMADLFRRHGTRLKKASDPASEARPNVKHIVDGLSGNAGRMAKRHPLAMYLHKIQEFRYDLFPVVPLDSCLRLFIETLESFPLPSGEDDTDQPLKDLTEEMTAMEHQFDDITLASSQKRAQPTTIYPDPIKTAIERAIAGMAYVYLPAKALSRDRATPEKVLRTKYTPYSAEEVRSIFPRAENAMFVTPW